MNATTADAGSATVTGQPQALRLRRSTDDKMLAGVAGGLARYLDADVTLVRVHWRGRGAVRRGVAADPRGRHGPAGRRGVAGRPPGPRPLTPSPTALPERRPITMPAIIVIALAAIIAVVALAVLGAAVHLLFSPWLLVAIAILAWIKFRPRRSRR